MTTAPSDRTRVKRAHERGHYDAATIHPILDAMPLCAVAYVFKGQPYVTPTLQWREGDHIYWHGSAASRTLESCKDMDVCVSVTILDGMVLARSAFNHSCNYRSVMVMGKAFVVEGEAAKTQHLKRFTEGLLPGRWDHLRPVKSKEVKATMILGLSLAEASAKVRQGPPVDDEEDYALPIWAGVIPLKTQILTPQADPKNLSGLAVPADIDHFKIG